MMSKFYFSVVFLLMIELGLELSSVHEHTLPNHTVENNSWDDEDDHDWDDEDDHDWDDEDEDCPTVPIGNTLLNIAIISAAGFYTLKQTFHKN